MADGFEIDIEKELAEFEAKERARLGLNDDREQWTDPMVNPFFSARERPTTTILNGGLTMAHDEFVAAALKGIGYNTRPLDCADTEALRRGKEFGNKAQCNPTYFTVGNLVKEVERVVCGKARVASLAKVGGVLPLGREVLEDVRRLAQ